jgi:hypothetical protein
MSGQTAGLVLVVLAGPYAAIQTWLGWREHKRDQRRADYISERDGL